MKEPYNWDEYAPYYFPKAEELSKRAAEAEKGGEKEKAAELYVYVWIVDFGVHIFMYHRRSSAVWRISRFPTPRGEKQKYAWKMGKEAFLNGQA
jgi:hypothetical protein